MRARFQNIFIVFFVAILAGIVFITDLTYQSTKDYQSTYQQVSHTQTVLEEAEQISSLSKDLQLESAGFYFTGDSSFLPVFSIAKREIINHLRTIKHLTDDNAQQQQRIDSLQFLVNRLIHFSEAFIQSREMNKISIIGTSDNFIQRKIFREKIGIVLNDLRAEEKRLLSIRQDANNKSAAVASNTFNALIVFIFLLVTLGFLLTLNYLNKRLKAEEELRISNDRFDMLVNNIKDFAIFMIDNNGIIINCYSGAIQMKGYLENEIAGKHISIFYTEEDKKNGIPERNLQNAAANGSYKEEGWRVKRDGTRFWADVVITAIYDNEGKVIGFTKITRDFTLHKQAADDMSLALEMAKELNTMKSNFVSLASHEFRTPLTSVLTSAILIEQYTTEEQQDKRERHTKKIRTSVATLTSILEEFLSLEKIESGKIQMKIATFNLRDLATSICEDAMNFGKPGQNMEYHHLGKEEVNLDPDLIRHILTNLTSNALKYSPENAHIEVFTSVLHNMVSIHVKDNGIGISEEDQRHLFDRFFRASNTGTIQGTGLGLHIIKRYVDMMNGTITVNSELGKGSEFVVKVECQVL